MGTITYRTKFCPPSPEFNHYIKCIWNLYYLGIYSTIYINKLFNERCYSFSSIHSLVLLWWTQRPDKLLSVPGLWFCGEKHPVSSHCRKICCSRAAAVLASWLCAQGLPEASGQHVLSLNIGSITSVGQQDLTIASQTHRATSVSRSLPVGLILTELVDWYQPNVVLLFLAIWFMRGLRAALRPVTRCFYLGGSAE